MPRVHPPPKRRTKKHPVATVVALATSLALVGSANAEPKAVQGRSRASDNRNAASLREKGNAAMASGRPADALEYYETVYAETHDPSLLYNLARAHQALTNYARAEELLADFKRQADATTLAKVPGLDELLLEIASRVHVLSVKCPVSGAEVVLGNRVLGTTPLEGPVRVNAGSYSILVRAKGYEPHRTRLELEGGKSSTHTAPLKPIDPRGLLRVTSPRAGATVVVDGQVLGDVPLEVKLTPGIHELVVEKDGYRSSKTQTVLAMGESKEMSVDLELSPPIYTRWWFWSGAALLVGGTAAAFAAWSSERPPPTGSIPPGQITFKLTPSP